MFTGTIKYSSLAISVLIIFIYSDKSLAQLSGSYTIGQGGEYQNFPDAVNALNTQGINGTVTFNIRAGTYYPAASDERIINIDQQIQGASEENRIVFQPDYFTGANVDNVILSRTEGSTSVSEGILILIRSSYVTIRELTLKNEDETTTNNLRSMIFINRPNVQTDIRNVEITGNKIFGRNESNRSFAAIMVQDLNYDLNMSNNVIVGCIVAIRMTAATNSVTDPIIENNQISQTGLYPGGGNLPAGEAIALVGCTGAHVNYNTIEYSGGGRGSAGIMVRGCTNFIINGNIIRNLGGAHGGAYDMFQGILATDNFGVASSNGLVSNNMISGIWTERRWGIRTEHSQNIKVYHNSVVFPDRTPWICHSKPFEISYSTNIDVKNNIFIELGSGCNFVMEISDTTTNSFDHNVLYTPASVLVRANATNYNSLENWQAAGHDSNSISKLPEFRNLMSDLRLFDCSSFDEELLGIYLADVPLDIDGKIRHIEHPYRGADEGFGELPGLFGTPHDYYSGDQSWLFTSYDLDNDGAIDLIFTNAIYYEGSNDVTILWNDGNGNFSDPQHLGFGENPNLVRVGYINSDNIPDLVVTNYDSVWVRFGTGNRTFGDPVLLTTTGGLGVFDLQLADYDNDGDTDIIIAHNYPNSSGIISILINDGDGTFTWSNFEHAGNNPVQIILEDFDNDGFLDLAVVDDGDYSLYILKNLGILAQGVSAGFDDPVIYNAQVYSVPSASKFVSGDFTGNGYSDIILGHVNSPDSLVLMMNNGDGSFHRTAFQVHPSRFPRVLAAFDYDDDGDLDLVTGNHSRDMHLLLNDGTGHFDRAFVCSQGALPDVPQAILTAPFHNIDADDIAVLSIASDKVTIFQNLQWIPTFVDNRECCTLPDTFALYQNYPNPFNPSTMIRFELPNTNHVNLIVYDMLGRRVAVLLDEELDAGMHNISFDATGLSSGIYFYRLDTGNQVQVRRMLFVK